MSNHSKNYFFQLRAQIANTYDLNDLRILVFELGLDWDELQGATKTLKIQDLITQMSRTGELEKAITLLKNQRPNVHWVQAPPPEKQKHDIKTAFPSPPFYQKLTFWGTIILVFVIVGIGIAVRNYLNNAERLDQLPVDVVALIPTGAPIPTTTQTPIPTSMPLPTQTPPPFEPEQEGETLIVISKFALIDNVGGNLLHSEILDSIEEKRNDLNLSNVRVELESTIIDPEIRSAQQVEAATQLGEIHNASLIIWGVEKGDIVEFNFLNLKEPDFDAASVNVELSKPDEYGRFVIEGHLQGQLAFLSFFSLGQAEYARSNFEEAIVLIETAVASIPNLEETFTTSLLDFSIDITKTYRLNNLGKQFNLASPKV